MKFAMLALAAVATIASVDAADKTTIHIRVHHAKQDDICYTKCPQGQWCARGADKTCRAPKPNTTECFNPATSQWIAKCDRGFMCDLGECIAIMKSNSGPHQPLNSRPSPGVPGGAICYDKCAEGQWCARGTRTCRYPSAGSTECFDLSQGLWIPKCGAGFSCKQGKCST